MKTFNMRADVLFEAENIDEAFLKLSEHFLALRQDKEAGIMTGGIITIEPLPDKEIKPWMN